MEGNKEHSINSVEIAFESYQRLISKHKKNCDSIFLSNEAKTRLTIIDEMLLLLGWDKDDFNPETHIKNLGYTDYLIKVNQVPRLVIEAKKIGDTFKNYQSRNSKNFYEVRYFKSAFKSQFSEVIEQARKYCEQTKVSFALLTNGAEWVVIQLIPPPGLQLDSSKGIYFGNIFSDCFEFDLFYNLLSRSAFDSSQLEEYLAEVNYSPSEISKVLRSDYSSLQWENSVPERYLSDFYEHFFSKITEPSQRSMLEFCFVSDSKLDSYKGELKRVLKDVKPKYLPASSLDLEPGSGKDNILDERASGQVIIITGSVGCGKSTLVTKCLVEARQSKGNLAKAILIDLINEVTRSEIDARKIIFKLIYDFISDNYDFVFSQEFLRKIYKKEIKAMEDGEFKDLFSISKIDYVRYEAELIANHKKNIEDFVLRSIKQLTSENNSVILIIDNVDRAHESFQEEMYALSHKISSKTGAKTIITLREFTFFKNKSSGFLDVRPEDKIIHLKAPDFNKLVSKRIKYIENKLGDDYRKKEWRRRYQDYDNFNDTMQKHAAILKHSILNSSDGHNIIETISSISWHNIRDFYEILHRVHRQLGSSYGVWSCDEVIASLMASPDGSDNHLLPNIFIPFKNVNQAYFLRLRLMYFLCNLKSSEISNGVPANRIFDYLKLYGYRSLWIKDGIVESVRQRFIECVEIPTEREATSAFNFNVNATYRISPLGYLLINKVIHNKVYQSLITVDLPFHSAFDFEKVKNEFNSVNSFMTNDERAVMFREGLDIVINSNLSALCHSYLSKQYRKERISSDSLISVTEIQLSERRISELFSSTTTEAIQTSVTPNPFFQVALDFGDVMSADREPEATEVDFLGLITNLDFDFDSPNKEYSEYIPLIICALRIRQLQGYEFSNGAELTEVINSHIVNSGNKKFPNNVSRALRSSNMMLQPWLACRADMHPRSKMFGLTEQWVDSWLEIFGKEPF